MISLKTRPCPNGAGATRPPASEANGAGPTRPRRPSLFRQAALALSLVLAGLTAPPTHAQTPVTLPFETDFESAEGYAPGPLTSHTHWQFGPALQAEILSPGAASSQALGFSGGDWLWLPTDSQGAPVSWIDFYTKPVFAEPFDLPEIIESEQSAVTGFVKLDAQGEVYAIDGDGLGGGLWTASGFRTALAADGESAFDWIRLTYRIDYFAKSWDLFVDGQLSLVDLGFLDDTRTALDEFAVLADADTPTLLDYFYAGNDNPLYTDSSGDGLPDDWLTAHGLDPSLYQRYTDPDLDGIGNLAEYRLGTSPVLADTDSDGLDDGLEHLLGYDPAVTEAHALGTLPFADGFEGDAPGPFASGTRLWTLTGEGAASVTAEADAPEGLHYLAANGADSVTLTRLFEAPSAQSTVWIDLRLKVGYLPDTPEITAPRAASAFYFADDGRLRALDGNGQGGGQWLALDHPPVGEGTWARLSVRHDYAAQTWSVWVDGVRRAQDLGFRDTVPAFSHLQIDQLNALDDVSVAAAEPAELDNDGDGLTNAEELALGIDPELADTSGDGWTDYEIHASGLDPTHSYLSPLPFVETFGSHATGALVPGTNNWLSFGEGVPTVESDPLYEDGAVLRLPASGDAAAEIILANHLDAEGLDVVWTDLVMAPVLFPDQATPEVSPEAVVLFYFGSAGKVFAYDGLTAQWRSVQTEPAFSPGEMVRITLRQDFAEQRWDFWVDGVAVFDGLGFAKPSAAYREFTVIAASAEDSLIDSVRIGTDGPNLNNPQPFEFPQWWIDQYFPGQTEVDSAADPDGDGLSNASEFSTSTDPVFRDHPDLSLLLF